MIAYKYSKQLCRVFRFISKLVCKRLDVSVLSNAHEIGQKIDSTNLRFTNERSSEKLKRDRKLTLNKM